MITFFASCFYNFVFHVLLIKINYLEHLFIFKNKVSRIETKLKKKKRKKANQLLIIYIKFQHKPFFESISHYHHCFYNWHLQLNSPLLSLLSYNNYYHYYLIIIVMTIKLISVPSTFIITINIIIIIITSTFINLLLT